MPYLTVDLDELRVEANRCLMRMDVGELVAFLRKHDVDEVPTGVVMLFPQERVTPADEPVDAPARAQGT